MNFTGVRTLTSSVRSLLLDGLEDLTLEEEEIESPALPLSSKNFDALKEKIAGFIRSKGRGSIPFIIQTMSSTQLCLEPSVEQQTFEHFILHGPWKETIVITALEALRKQAEKKHPVAQLLLGLCYEAGAATSRDSTLANRYIRFAADQGFGLAQAIYSCEYLQEKDPPLAFDCAKRSARQGCAHGYYALATCYRKGIFVEKEAALAFKTYLEGAKRGSSSAQLWLGTCYMQGSGVKQNQTLGFEEIKRSAEQGDAAGQKALIICLARGLGTKKDDGWAHYWEWSHAPKESTSSSALLRRLYLQSHTPQPEFDRGDGRSSASSSPHGLSRVVEEDLLDGLEFPLLD